MWRVTASITMITLAVETGVDNMAAERKPPPGGKGLMPAAVVALGVRPAVIVGRMPVGVMVAAGRNNTTVQ